MAAGDVTQGRRLADGTLPHDLLQPGDYARRGHRVFAMAPDETLCSVEEPTWTITEHEDGTLTVSPSIFVNAPTGWHGFLERGVWREV